MITDAESVLMPIYLTVLFTVLVGIGTVLFVVYYLRRLYLQKTQLIQLKSDHRKHLLDASMQTQERERERISQNLHDEVGALLSTIKLYSSHLGELKDAQARQSTVDKITHLVDDTITNLRTISHDLAPQLLNQFGLAVSLEKIAEQLNQAPSGPDFLLENKVEDMEWPTTTALHLYRLIQELINNTLKHAQARQISLSLQSESSFIRIHYQDDGLGMAAPPDLMTQSQPGLGWKSIASRVELLNGTLSVQTAHQQGLSVQISLPVPNEVSV
ncbi:MAG: ATP-binding protein [Bacteroidota bacterium]